MSVLPHFLNLPLSVLSGSFQFNVFNKLTETVHPVISSPELFEAYNGTVALVSLATRVDRLRIELVERDIIH